MNSRSYVLYLLKQLQAVSVVIVCKIHDSFMTRAVADVLPQPAESQVPLHGATRNTCISGLL